MSREVTKRAPFGPRMALAVFLLLGLIPTGFMAFDLVVWRSMAIENARISDSVVKAQANLADVHTKFGAIDSAKVPAADLQHGLRLFDDAISVFSNLSQTTDSSRFVASEFTVSLDRIRRCASDVRLLLLKAMGPSGLDNRDLNRRLDHAFGLLQVKVSVFSNLLDRQMRDQIERRASLHGLFLVGWIVLLAGLCFALLAAERRRSKAAKDLAVGEEWLATTLKSIGDGVIATDSAGRVALMNAVAQALTGWGEEAVGKPIEEVFRIINESSRQTVEGPVGRVLREGRIVGLANHTLLVAKDGTEKAIDDSGAPIVAGDGHMSGVVLVFRDVTEKREGERALQYRLEREELISDISASLVSAQTHLIREVVQHALAKIGKHKRADRCGIFLFSPDRTLLINTQEWCAEGVASVIDRIQGVPSRSLPWITGKCLGREVLRIGRVSDLTAEAAAEANELTARGTRSMLAVPLLYGPDAQGFIALESVREERVWSEETVGLLRTLGDMLIHSITRQHLERSMRLQGDVVHQIQDGLITTDLNGVIQGWYKGALRMLGYSSVEMWNKDFGSLLAEGEEFPAEAFRLAKESGFARTELRLRRKNDEVIVGDVSISRHRDTDDSIFGLILCITDVTEHRRSEEALKYRLEFENLVTGISTAFISIPIDQIEAEVQKTFEAVAEFTGADRLYLFLFTEDGTALCNTHEWCGEGIVPRRERLQRLPLDKYPWAIDRLTKNQHISCRWMDDIPVDAEAERDLVSREGIRSTIVVPLMFADEFRGVFGLEAIKTDREWSDDVLSLMRIVGEMLVSALTRRWTESTLAFRSLILSQVHDSVVTTDLVGNITHWNGGAERLFGYTEGEIAFRSASCLLADGQDGFFENRVRMPLLEKGLYETEVRMKKKSGEEFWGLTTFSLHIDTTGKVSGMICCTIDITARKAAEEGMRASQERYELAINATNDAIWDWDLVNDTMYRSPRTADLLGYDLSNIDEPLGIWQERTHPDDRARVKEIARAHLEDGAPHFAEYRFRVKSGEYRWFQSHGQALFGEDGRAYRMVGSLSDIHERKMAEQALRESERQLLTLMGNLPGMVYRVRREEPDWVIAFVSEGAIALTGHQPSDLVGLSAAFYASLILPDDQEEVKAAAARGVLAREPYQLTYRIRTAQGQEKVVWEQARCMFDENDEPACIEGFVTDVTSRVHSEEALRQSREQLSLVLEGSKDAFWDWNMETGTFTFSPRWAEMLGYDPTEFVKRTQRSANDDRLDGEVHPDDVEEMKRNFLDHMEGRTPYYESEHRVRTKSGEYMWILDRGKIVTRDATGKPTRAAGTHTNITDRKKAEEALRRNQEQLSLVLEGSKDAFWDWDLVTDRITSSPRWAEMLGANSSDSGLLNGEGGVDTLGSEIHPDDLAATEKAFKDHLNGLTPFIESEHRVKTRSGSYIWVLDRGKVVERDENGKALRATGTHTDITDRKVAEEERRRLELSIQQAQKLESLGVLAGGIAHDFNNLLMGILGNAGLVLMDLTPESPARDSVQQIETAAQRAADLARQMLAYSGRGTFLRESLNLNLLVEEMAHLLQVSISKSCVLKFNFAHNLPMVEADATQIRQVVMNLITNASEAVGDRSGVITVSTGALVADQPYLANTYLDEDLPEGLYAYVEVSDTGCGMDLETRTRIFDPFFTTKFTGRGLGLAAVLGIARGHKGAIRVYSEVGRGTTIKILLPGTGSIVGMNDQEKKSPNRWQGDGTVLVVDDEETVRAVAKRMLEHYGFRVLTATDGMDGVRVFEENQKDIALVLLDMTMPKMSGDETYMEMRRICPDVRVILSSGYNEQEATSRFAGKALAGYIQKPYSPQALAEKLQQVLEA